MKDKNAKPDAAVLPRVLTHYNLTAPLIERHFGGAPIVYRNFPAGLETGGAFHRTPIPLTATKLLWCVHAKFALEPLTKPY